MGIFKTTVAVLSAAIISASASSADTIAPIGTTDVTVDAAVVDFLTTAGITPSPIAPATASAATFMFPITGGSFSTLTITHSGGVRFEDGSMNFIEATDFVIKGAGGTVSASIFGSAYPSIFDADIFDLANVDTSGPITADLVINATLNGALGQTFAGGQDLGLTGVTFGAATTSPQPVPLPAAGLMLFAALGSFAAVRRRRLA